MKWSCVTMVGGKVKPLVPAMDDSGDTQADIRELGPLVARSPPLIARVPLHHAAKIRS
jgi:hypothetical protein